MTLYKHLRANKTCHTPNILLTVKQAEYPLMIFFGRRRQSLPFLQLYTCMFCPDLKNQ